MAAFKEAIDAARRRVHVEQLRLLPLPHWPDRHAETLACYKRAVHCVNRAPPRARARARRARLCARSLSNARARAVSPVSAHARGAGTHVLHQLGRAYTEVAMITARGRRAREPLHAKTTLTGADTAEMDELKKMTLDVQISDKARGSICSRW